MEGNLPLKIDWASLVVGSKFTVFALFYFVFEGNFPSTSPQGAYIWRGLYMEGLIFGILRYFAQPRKSYRIGLLFTPKSSCGGAISVTEGKCAAPISKVRGI